LPLVVHTLWERNAERENFRPAGCRTATDAISAALASVTLNVSLG
jgi:hypothetical protein